MGRGGTKFVGEAISHRSGRQRECFSSKEMRLNMQKYLETGYHPDMEAAALRERDLMNKIVPLPDFDANRPFVFLDISIAGKNSGRLVIELFEEQVSAAATHFRNRCLQGSRAGLAGSAFYKLHTNYAIFGGKNQAAATATRLPTSSDLRAQEIGTVSVSITGEEFVIALGKALVLDSTHQVVGRVHLGNKLLETFNEMETLPDDSPADKVFISRCGVTNYKGEHCELDEDGRARSKPPSEAQVEEDCDKARKAVRAALRVGLGMDGKSKVGEKRPSDALVESKISHVRQKIKSQMMNSMLGDLSSDSNSDENEEDHRT